MRTDTLKSPIRLVPMVAVLLPTLLWAAESTGWFALLFLLPIALCVLPLAEEKLFGWLIAIDLLTSAFVLFLPVSHLVWVLFVCVLAPYVPVRHALSRMKQPRHATLLTVGIIAVWTAGVLAVLYWIGVFPPVWLNGIRSVFLTLGFFVFLFLLDAAYQLYLKFYRTHLRRFLLPRA